MTAIDPAWRVRSSRTLHLSKPRWEGCKLSGTTKQALAESGPGRYSNLNVLNLGPYIIADFLNPSFRLGMQLIDKVSESRNLFFNGQIAIRLGSRRVHT